MAMVKIKLLVGTVHRTGTGYGIKQYDNIFCKGKVYQYSIYLGPIVIRC
jgi:hypothetical protein